MISHVFMSLNNGHKTIATIVGTVQLSSSLILHRVYYIPNFHISLTSITLHLDTIIYDVFISINCCLILKILTRIMLRDLEDCLFWILHQFNFKVLVPVMVFLAIMSLT